MWADATTRRWGDKGGAGLAGAPSERSRLLVPAAHRRRLAGELQALAGIDDADALLGLLYLEDGHVAVDEIADVEVLTVGAPHRALRQPLDLDLADFGYRFVVNLEDDHAALAVVEP